MSWSRRSWNGSQPLTLIIMKIVMFHEVAEDGLVKTQVHFEAHRPGLTSKLIQIRKIQR
jgi:hypothetical protein